MLEVTKTVARLKSTPIPVSLKKTNSLTSDYVSDYQLLKKIPAQSNKYVSK
jgi:hypothetical protein